MKIRKAGKADIESIIELWWQMEISHTCYDPKFYSKKSRADCLRRARRHYSSFLNKSRSFILVAEGKGEVVGFLKGSVMPRPPIYTDKKQGWIESLVVDRAHRRKGVATRLMKTAEREFKKRKVKMSVLEVEKKNQGGRRFYSGLGYQNRHIRVVKYL